MSQLIILGVGWLCQPHVATCTVGAEVDQAASYLLSMLVSTSCQITILPTSCQVTILPTSCQITILPTSCQVTILPTSCQITILPFSCQVTILPTSCQIQIPANFLHTNHACVM